VSPSSGSPAATTRADAADEQSEGTAMSATDTGHAADTGEADTGKADAENTDVATDAEPTTAPAAEAGSDGTDGGSDGPAPAAPAKGGRTLPIVLAVLVVAAAVAVGLLGVHAWTLYQGQQDAAAALDQAKTRTVQVLSYDPKTVDADVARAKEQLSGSFAAQFDQLANVLILPSAKQQGLTSEVDVKNAAIIDSQADRAEVLILLHQKVSSSATPQPVEGTIQVKTTVSKGADGQWLISNLQPLA
jgi:Mce-associated membrane protein